MLDVCQGDAVSSNEDNCTGKIKDRNVKVLNSLQQNFRPRVVS